MEPLGVEYEKDSGMEPPGVEYEKDSGMEQVFILSEWSKYLFMKIVVKVLIRLCKHFMNSKGHKC